MTLPRKGSRKIVVDERGYRWVVRKKPTHGAATGEANLRAIVELNENPASVLLIDFLPPRNKNLSSNECVEVGPKHIANAIRAAIDDGWKPAEAGANFEISRVI